METITQQEMNTILDFFKKHSIAWLGAEGNKNGETLGNYFDLWAQSSPTKQTIPFTQQTLEIAVKQLHDSLIFYSEDESQFHLYEEQYPEQLETIRKFLPSYRLSTEGDDLFVNTNIIMEFCISTGRVHQITKESLQSVIIGNLINRPGVRALHYKATPAEVAQQKRWENTRAKESTKSALEIAKAKADQAKHVMLPDGRRMSDVIMAEFFETHPEAAAEATTPAQTTPPVNPVDAHWEQRTKDFIQSISSNLLRAEAEQLYGHKNLDSWRATYRALEIWHDRKKNSTDGSRWAR